MYRSKDPDHLLFQNRIRVKQPTRQALREYFGSRHWKRRSLSQYVADGMHMGAEQGEQFTWLTATNKGSAQVCLAALQNLGITEADLKNGYSCDPQTKSDLRILARPGIVLRLSRNHDKFRGFVNGAVCVVEQSLYGNTVFTAKLLASGNLVLVHPMEEDGVRFLPCCYGYATTIRRAQGVSLSLGCIYFDQHYHAAQRGYGYVAVSRFRTKAGCHLYGKMRRTDFLPVGDEASDEDIERTAVSQSESDSEDGSGPMYDSDDDDDPFGIDIDDEGMDELRSEADRMNHNDFGEGRFRMESDDERIGAEADLL